MIAGVLLQAEWSNEGHLKKKAVKYSCIKHNDLLPIPKETGGTIIIAV